MYLWNMFEREREKTKYCRKLFILEWVAVIIRIYLYIYI